MSNKYVFQNAQIKNRESKLLTLQGVQRLFDAQTTRDAMKVLIELGFGSGMTIEDDNFDAVFKNEEENLCLFLKEMNVGGALDVFLLENDYVNLKIAAKAFATKTSTDSYLPGGLYDVEQIRNAFETGEVIGFDKKFESVIKEVALLIASENANPRELDAFVDKKEYEHIFSVVSKSGKEATEYFRQKADMANIATFARVKKLGLDIDFFNSCFIDGGRIGIDKFDAQDMTLDGLALLCKDTVYAKLTADLAQSGNVVACEVASENALLKMWKDNDFDMFSIAPIVAYYMTKKTELKVAKLIVAGIKNHVAPQIIKERMRELYA